MSLCSPLDVNIRLAVGYLCEYDDKHVKVFEVKKRQLIVLPNCYESEMLQIGKMYIFNHMSMQEVKKGHDFHNGNVFAFVKNPNDVHFQTVALSPEKKALSTVIYQKYQGKVWSAYLGFLRDPKKLFRKKVDSGELGYVEAKYAPDGDTVFELVHAECPVQLNEELAPAPWALETAGLPLEPTPPHPSEVVFTDKYKRMHDTLTLVRYGICVQTDVGNSSYRPDSHGSTLKCAHLFSLRFGMYRCVQTVRLGAWYQHVIQDNRRKSKKFGPTTYASVRAAKLVEIDDPLPTRVVNGAVQIDVEFPFDEDVLWSKECGLKTDAYFWNDYLGKGEIYPEFSEIIMQQINDYRDSLLEPMGNITVLATVRLHPCRYDNNLVYPTNGLFLVNKVNGLKDSKGDIIEI